MVFNLDLRPVHLGYTCGGGAGRGRLLDRPENLQQIGIPEGDAPEEQFGPFMDQEDQVQQAEIPRLQYASSGTICWQNETVVDRQVVPWDEQKTLVWEQNKTFSVVAKCLDKSFGAANRTNWATRSKPTSIPIHIANRPQNQRPAVRH